MSAVDYFGIASLIFAAQIMPKTAALVFAVIGLALQTVALYFGV